MPNGLAPFAWPLGDGRGDSCPQAVPLDSRSNSDYPHILKGQGTLGTGIGDGIAGYGSLITHQWYYLEPPS